MWLHSCIIAFVCRCVFNDPPLCESCPCKSLTVGSLWWYKGLRIKPAACVSASRRVRGREGHFDLGKDEFNFKHVPLLPRSSLVSPWQLCALFPVALETLCVRKLRTSLHTATNPTSDAKKTLSAHSAMALDSLTLSDTGRPWVPPPVLAGGPACLSLPFNELSLNLKGEINLLFPQSSWQLGPFVYALSSGRFHWAAINSQTNLAQLSVMSSSHLPPVMFCRRPRFLLISPFSCLWRWRWDSISSQRRKDKQQKEGPRG